MLLNIEMKDGAEELKRSEIEPKLKKADKDNVFDVMSLEATQRISLAYAGKHICWVEYIGSPTLKIFDMHTQKQREFDFSPYFEQIP